LALKAAGIEDHSHPPILRTTSIFHYCLDRELLIKDALYVWCMDPKFKSFRITLYPNLNPEKQNTGYTITSEVLSNPEESKQFNSEMILKELISLGIVAKDSKVLCNTQQVIHNTFPVPEVGFMDDVNRVSEKLQKEMSNLLLFGRSTGKTWFMTDVFRDVFERIKGINN
jgi:protoporphyrinogen oxidase